MATSASFVLVKNVRVCRISLIMLMAEREVTPLRTTPLPLLLQLPMSQLPLPLLPLRFPTLHPLLRLLRRQDRQWFLPQPRLPPRVPRRRRRGICVFLPERLLLLLPRRCLHQRKCFLRQL